MIISLSLQKKVRMKDQTLILKYMKKVRMKDTQTLILKYMFWSIFIITST